jgi:hypothetical protein
MWLFREDRLEVVKFERFTWSGERILEAGQKLFGKGGHVL